MKTVGAVSAIGTLIWASYTIEKPPSNESSVVDASPVCETKTIPYRVREVESDEYGLGVRWVEIVGRDGSKRVCTHADNTQTSVVLQKPFHQRVIVGTYVKPVYIAPAGCPVTTCNDGSCSYSTGRGTCSWHGGIAY